MIWHHPRRSKLPPVPSTPLSSPQPLSGADEHIEVFCKDADGCEEGVLGLAREMVAACIADCLELPIPDPWLVELPAALPDALQECVYRENNSGQLECSVRFAVLEEAL